MHLSIEAQCDLHKKEKENFENGSSLNMNFDFKVTLCGFCTSIHRRVNVTLLLIWFVSSLHTLIPVIVIITVAIMSQGTQDAMPVLHKLAGVEILIWMFIFCLAIIFNICTTLAIYKKLCNLQLRSRTVCNSRLINVSPTIKKKQEAFVTLFLLLLASLFCRLPFPIIGIVGFTSAAKVISHFLSTHLTYFFRTPIAYFWEPPDHFHVANVMDLTWEKFIK